MKTVTIFLIVSTSCFAQFGAGQLIYDTPISGGRVIKAADFDNDGNDDVVLAIRDFIAWYPNEGNGVFGDPIPIQLDKGQSFGLTTADLNNDNNIDLIVSFFDDDQIIWYQNLGGVFSSPQLITSNVQRARGVLAEDLDGDGDLDLVLGVSNGLGLYWMENIDGLGNFGPRVNIYPTISQAREQAIADIDGDGDMDILSNGGSGITLIWFENLDGLGDFSSEHILDTGGLYEVAIALEDLDGDGDIDIISQKTDDVVWRENLDGLGNFGPITIISSDVINGSDILVADLDNDNDLDVISTSIGFDMPEDHKVAWYENLGGAGSFGPQQLIDNTLLFPRSVDAADLDNDGDLDVLAVAFHPNDRRALWYENLTILDVDDLDNTKITLYPNPVEDILNIEKGALEILKIEVLTILGTLLLEETRNTSAIDLSSLPIGMLFVRLHTTEGVQVEKVLKR